MNGKPVLVFPDNFVSNTDPPKDPSETKFLAMPSKFNKTIAQEHAKDELQT